MRKGNRATYRRIIDGVQQVKQDGHAVLAIGLGGTGIDCLRHLKRKIYERLPPDNPGGEVPRYDHIRFLAVDTDVVGMRKVADSSWGAPGELDLSQEFFDISCQDKLSDLLQKRGSNNFARNPAYREWLQFDEILLPGKVDRGAGGVRQIGRFLLMRKASNFVLKVKDLVRQATKGSRNNDGWVYVHVFSGMGGGTGSGIFLDVCYLVQEVLRREGVEYPVIMGYFFLPDVNLSKREIPNNVRQYIEHNGYAAMQELDYCMGFGRNGDHWHQEYPDVGEVHSVGDALAHEQPVHLCHLISTREDEIPADAYGHAMNVVADYVMDFLIMSEWNLRAHVLETCDIKSHILNMGNPKEYVRRYKACTGGTCSHYLALGDSCVTLPYGDIMAYLVSGLLRRLEESGLRKRVPSEDETGQLLKDVGLIGDSLLQEVRRDVDLDPGRFDARPADALKEDPDVEKYYMDLEATAKGIIAQNLLSLSGGVPYWDTANLPPDKRYQPVMSRIVDAMRKAIEDPKRGPWYASAFVRGNKGVDLMVTARGIKAWAEGMCKHENAQLAGDGSVWKSFYEARKSFYGTSSFDPRLRRRYDAFVEMTCELTRCRIRRDSYEALAKLAENLGGQLERFADELIDPLVMSVGWLFDTFGEALPCPMAFAGDMDPFGMPIVTMREVAPRLDAELDGRDADIVAYGFDADSVTRWLLRGLANGRGMNAWEAGGDALLEYLFSDYLLRRFLNNWIERSLSKYRIRNYLEDKVLGDSQPFFWADKSYSTADAHAMGYINTSGEVDVMMRTARALCASDNTLTGRKTAAADRISILRVLVGVPMWAFQGTAQYERGYQPAPGRHLYERAVYVKGVSDPAEVEASRDWGKLPSPTPRSKMGISTSPEMRRRADEAAGVLDDALREGIIVRGEGSSYFIRTISDGFVMRVRACREVADGELDCVRRAVRTKLLAMNVERVYDPKKHFLTSKLNSQYEGVEKAICADLLAKAPVLVEIVRRELEKCREIARCIEDLEPKG